MPDKDTKSNLGRQVYGLFGKAPVGSSPKVFVVDSSQITGIFVVKNHNDKKAEFEELIRERNAEEVLAEFEGIIESNRKIPHEIIYLYNNTVLDDGNTVVLKHEIKTPNQGRNTSPPVEMPKGDAPALESKENIQGRFTSVAEAKAFGEMFQRAREGEGKSQRATARESGIDPKNLRQIERGITDPSLKTIRRIADSIGYKIELMLIPKGKE